MSSWLGEIQCWIKLCAKTKYEIFLFSAEEMNILKEKETFGLTQLPLNKTVIPAQRVYAIKTDQNQEEIYKARFVGKGCSQKSRNIFPNSKNCNTI